MEPPTPNIYDEEHIIECNRQKSDQSLSSSNSQTNAEWTTILGDIVHIDPGDKISMYGAYINERGCGSQGRTIEIKGSTLGNRQFTYSNLEYSVPEDNLQGHQYQSNEQITETISIKDNEATIGVSYYKNADGSHYYFGVRRFISDNAPAEFGLVHSAWSTPDVPYNWGVAGIYWGAAEWDTPAKGSGPNLIDTGRPVFEVRSGNIRGGNPTGTRATGRFRAHTNLSSLAPFNQMSLMRNFIYSDFREYPQLYTAYIQGPTIGDRDIQPIGQMNLWKPKNDNTKYTMFIRRKSAFYVQGQSSDTSYMPGPADIGPENTWLEGDATPNGMTQSPLYSRYIEKKTITIPAGFNSGQFISEEVSRQLSQIKKETTFDYENAKVGVDTSYRQGMANTVESECYKPFNVSGTKMTSSAAYVDFVDALEPGGSKPTNWTDWFNQYQMIGIKRPELYETGFYVNKILDDRYTGSRGAYVVQDAVGGPLATSIPYTKANLLNLKAFIEAQDLYPEIWDNMELSYSDYTSATKITNTRWFHINKFTNIQQTETARTNVNDLIAHESLGCSGLRLATAVPHLIRISFLFFTYYDSTQKDTFYEIPTNDETPVGSFVQMGDRYSYGTFGIFRQSETLYTVVLYPNKAPEPLPEHLRFPLDPAGGDLPPLADTDKIEMGRKIGFDLHFNAPGTIAMIPYNGELERPYVSPIADLDIPQLRGNYTAASAPVNNGVINPDGSASYISGPYWVPDKSSSTQGGPDFQTYMGKKSNLHQYLNQIYMGASSPTLNFDGNHFSWSYLHTPVQKGNSALAGLNADFPTETDPGTEVYKINPYEHYNDFTPERQPYPRLINAHETGGTNLNSSVAYNLGNDGKIPFNRGDILVTPIVPENLNRNLIPYEVYDSKTGIFIEDWGYDESTWDQGLWATLGFTYAQFHSKNNNRLQRIAKQNSNSLSVLTTNSEMLISDTKVRAMTPLGHPTYSLSIEHPWAMTGTALISSKDVVAPGGTEKASWGQANYTEIQQNTKSIEIRAQQLPKSMVNGYYGIRSDIMSECGFSAGNRATLPMLGVVNKTNAVGDFYFGTESDISFVANKHARISAVNIKITDPDGSYATCSPDSTILIKVSKPRKAIYDIAAEILAEEQSAQQGPPKK